MPSMPFSISFVFQPAMAIYSIACPLSVAENFVFAPISLAFAPSFSISSPVAPDIAPTFDIWASKSANVFTEMVAAPVIAVVTPISFSPTPLIFSPAFCIPSPSSFNFNVESFCCTCPSSVSMFASSRFAYSVCFSFSFSFFVVVSIVDSVLLNFFFKLSSSLANAFVSSLFSPVSSVLFCNAASVAAICSFKSFSLSFACCSAVFILSE